MADPQRLDTVLKGTIAVLLVGILGLGAWFGYTVYADRKAAEDANPALRTMKVIKAQVEKNPNDALLRVRLGEAYAAANRSQNAIEQFNAALKIDPKHSGAYLDLGMLAMVENRPDEAQTYLKKVIELTAADEMAAGSDRREMAFYNLGRLAMRQKEWETAIGYFKEAVRIRDDASDTYYYLASSLEAIGQTEDAKKNLLVALQFDPNFSQAHYLMAKLLLAEGDKVGASAEVGASLRLSPTAPEPAKLAEQIGDPAELAKQAAELYPSDPEAAFEAAAIAFNLDPRNSIAAGKLQAQILLDEGRKKDALKVYQRIAEVAATDSEVKDAIKKLAPKSKTTTTTPSN
jgi:tetratricopeptide (TPR) repeat protein